MQHKEQESPNYRMGDKVMITKAGTHKFEIGEIVTIGIGINSDEDKHSYRAHGEDDWWWVNDSEIEPYTPSMPIHELINQHNSAFNEFVAVCDFIRTNEDFLNRYPEAKRALIDASEKLKNQSMDILDQMIKIKTQN